MSLLITVYSTITQPNFTNFGCSCATFFRIKSRKYLPPNFQDGRTVCNHVARED